MRIKSFLPTNKIIPVVVFLICLSVILIIPFRIISYGFMPSDDALRHTAKVISGKTWNQILVLRPDVTMDSHPGWHAILSAFQKATQGNIDALIVFSVVSLFLLFTLVPFIFLKRPEGWLLTLIIFFLFGMQITMRLFFGRPYIFTMAVLIFILFGWQRFKEKKFPIFFFAITTGLIAASTWIHCLWYLYALLIFSFLAAREWRASVILSISATIGILLGAAFTGNPIQFFVQTINHGIHSLNGAPLTRMLASEFLPSGGDIIIVMTVIFMFGFSALRGNWSIKKIDNPVFILALSGWILGLLTQRFWLDWGLPALLVWMSLEFEEALTTKIGYASFKRLLIATVSAITLYCVIVPDVHSRWTSNLTTEYLSLDNPLQREWLPEQGGIIYSADMKVFYQTFYKNPKANWRYMVGFEPTMMPDKDLKVYRNIHWNLGVPESYAPWVKKMKPRDRLILKKPQVNPAAVIKELEWNHITGSLWVGRLPKQKISKESLLEQKRTRTLGTAN